MVLRHARQDHLVRRLWAVIYVTTAAVCTLAALLMTHLIEKRDAHMATMSQPASQPTRTRLQSPEDEPMDVDPTPPGPPCLPIALSSLAAPQRLPFPGEFVDGVRDVVYYDL